MPLPTDSQPAARETCVVHTADIHMSATNGTDIWLDVRIGMAKPDCNIPKRLACMENEKKREYGVEAPNPSTLFDGVVPIIFEQHTRPGQCATTFFNQGDILSYDFTAWQGHIESQDLPSPKGTLHILNACGPVLE